MSEIAVKPGRHREATLYHALHGAGAGDGRTLEQLREAALKVYEAAELPVWRRSGFWTTSFEGLDFDALEVRHHSPRAHEGTSASDNGDAPPPHTHTHARGGPANSNETPAGPAPDDAIPAIVRETLPERPRAGRIVQLDGSVVHVELDPELARRGVLLCSLEDAAREHTELFTRWYSKRLTYDRNKLEAANAALWTGGAFLHVPGGLQIEDPFEIVYAIDGPGVAQYGRTLIVGERASDFRVHEYDLAGDFEGQALHAGAFELYLQDGARCRLAQVQDWGSPRAADAGGGVGGAAGPGAGPEVFDASTRFVGVGRDAYCHWLPALLGGHLVRQHLELAVCEPGGDMAFRGVFFAQEQELLDVFAVDLHETGPSGGDVHWRGAATGSSRASFEGLIQIDPGAQQTHTYLQIHTMMLSPKARLDAIPSVLVSADDVSASHGGTVGELDEDVIFYMQSRGLDRTSAVRVIVEGFFEPLISQLDDEPLEEVVRTKIAAKLAAARADIEAYAASR